MKCEHCGSEDTHLKETYDFGTTKIKVYQCHKCSKTFKKMGL